MQTIYAKIRANRAEIYNFFKWLTIPLVLVALYYQLVVKTDYKQALEVFATSLSKENIGYLLLSILLVPINFSFEAVKWQKLVHPLHTISFKTSIKSILAGISLSIFTPKRLGEYGGRVLLLSKNRKEAITALFVGNLSQSIANLILGLASFGLFINYYIVEFKQLPYVIVASICFLIVLCIFYFNLGFASKYLMKLDFFKKHSVTIEIVKEYNKQTLFQILALSILKYATFILQFVLIIKAFGISISLLWGIVCASCVFFIKTMLPVPASVELAARGSIAIFFFSFLTENHIGILVASILLWIINLAVPALLGSLLISKTKI